MASNSDKFSELVEQKYQHGFVTDIEEDLVPPGLDEDVIRLISRKKDEPEFLTGWRLNAYRHWLMMTEPNWAHVSYKPIDYQSISYYAAPSTPLFSCMAHFPRSTGVGVSLLGVTSRPAHNSAP